MTNLNDLFKEVYSSHIKDLMSNNVSSPFMRILPKVQIKIDNKIYYFNSEKELEEFKIKYEHDKQFKNKLETLIES